ncbi:MAG: hypothetical protein PF690_02735, partial [Deltaproteobacteria bacterium]|nr:hypothetical protein [Deltaproteobacteria bacterium]
YTLEGEEIFAKIFTCFENGILRRKIKISDFDNNILHDIEYSSINLTPSNVHKDMDKSFFESHLEEVPGLLEHIIPTIVNEDSTFNDLPINTKKLQSRFGKKLKGLKRIVLAGMGTSNHVTFFAAGLIRTILPDIQVVCIQPVDISLPSSMFISDSDLVLLVSWSSTTAEMVKLAQTLNSMNVLFAGITEKTFGDMGIITQKNCGTIHVMSGEEITIPAIKSTFCSLLSIDLLILWLYNSIMEKQIDYTLLGNIRQLPEITKQIISNKKIKNICENLAFSYADTETFYIIDALNTTGTGYEAALKMEEMTWSVKTNAVDYKNVDINLFTSFKTKNFIIINATSQERIIEALEIMEVFHKADIEFFAVTSEGSRIDRIETLSKGKMIILPRTNDYFQPFADLIFYYMLAFYSGNARVRKADDYPRNRAKSITTSRSMSSIKSNYQEEFFHIRNREKNISKNIEDTDYTTLTKWESFHFKDWAKEYFHMMRSLAQAMSCDNPFSTLFDYNEKLLEVVYSSIFDSKHDNDLFFLPLDLAAKTSVQNTIAKLNRFLPSKMNILTPTDPLSFIDSDSIVILVSSTGDPNDIPNDFAKIEKSKIIWFGHKLLNNKTKFPMNKCVFKKDFKGIESSVLYAGLSLMLINTWKLYNFEKGNDLEKHFKRSCNVILSILNDQNLANDIIRVMHANQEYRSLYYLCPFDGTGNNFVKKFDMEGNRLAKWLSFGTGAHGSLVTIDNRVDTKYVRLEKREIMIQKYGEEKTIKWEKKYLNGKNINLYLETMPNDLTSRVETPFFAEGEWYLPILRPEYKTCEDNLIVLDATSEINYDQATDDLAVFGCRHARIIIITQQAFLEMPEKNSIQKFPLSGMLALPAIKGFDQSIPLSDIHLPFAINLMGAAMAGNITQTDLS